MFSFASKSGRAFSCRLAIRMNRDAHARNAVITASRSDVAFTPVPLALLRPLASDPKSSNWAVWPTLCLCVLVVKSGPLQHWAGLFSHGTGLPKGGPGQSGTNMAKTGENLRKAKRTAVAPSDLLSPVS